MRKKTDRKSKTGEAPKAQKLSLKKSTLKDLTAPARGQQVKGGRYGFTDSCRDVS